MGIGKTIKNMFNGEIDDEYEDGYATDDTQNDPAEVDETSEEEPMEEQFQEERSIHIEPPQTKGSVKVVLIKPVKFEEATSIADHLNSKRTVVLNLESCNEKACRRLLDFLSGAAYANGGQIQRVSNRTFIITPRDVTVEGDLMEQMNGDGSLN